MIRYEREFNADSKAEWSA